MFLEKTVKTKAKSLALGLALTLALAAAPQALAGPAFGGGDLGDAVYGFFAQIWHSVSSVVGAQDEYGAYIIPNGEEAEFSGPAVIPNGSSGDSGSEYGPWVIPNGSTTGPGQIPDVPTAEESVDDEFGPMVIPNG